MVAQAAPPKVLVIDDEDLFREMLRSVLGGEYQVLLAGSAEEGLRILERECPEAILLDLVMPGRDGLQGLKAIRSLNPQVPVIIVTGYGKLESAKEAMSLGASFYVEKPVQPDELRKAIRTCVERTRLEKRRADSMAEMTGVIRQLSSELQRKAEAASEGEAALELMYDLARPLADAIGHLEQMSSRLRKEGAIGADELRRMTDSLTLIEHNMRRCRELTQMCRDIGRKATNGEEAVAIGEIVNAVVQETAPWASAGGLRVDLRVYANGVLVWGHKQQLRRAVKNLVASAIQSSMGHAAVVRVGCVADNTHVEIRVEDHGPGYDMEQLPLDLGDRFGPRDIVKGAGLGFCLTRRVIEEHGGCLHVRSAPGRGTVVFVRLPRFAPERAGAKP